MALVAEEEKHSILGDSKHMILGKMKNQFNSSGGQCTSENDLQFDEEVEGDATDTTDTTTHTKTESEERSDSSESYEDNKPPIIVSIRKNRNNKMATRSSNVQQNQYVETEGPKRSARRRSKDCNESVLQSAIARKEKSYNETTKPQRLTRQLKPTQKILDNIASAAALKDRGTKKEKKRKLILGENKRKSETTFNNSEAKIRRSGRLSSQHVNNSESDEFDAKVPVVQEHNGTDNVQCEEKSNFSFDLNEDSATAQLIASRLCVCTSPTKYMPLSESSIYCNALDSISNRLIGCNNNVKKQNAWMLRPSTRVPYMVMCNLHQQRLQNHHCCAMCGIFCTQGSFLQCINKHLYHQNCKLSIGALECCPHCGTTEKHSNVTITMESDRRPVYTSMQCSESGQPRIKPQASGTSKLPLKSRVGNIQSNSHTSKRKEKVIVKCDEVDEELDIETCNEKEKLSLQKEETIRKDAPVITSASELEELERLEARKGEINTEKNSYNIEELFEAIKKGLYAEVATLLGDTKINLNQHVLFTEATEINNEETGTVLHYAAKHGFVPIMHMLKIADMDLNLTDSENNTPLMVAVEKFQNEAVKYLTSAGASVTAKGTDGMTALHLACKFGNLSATKELLLAAAHIKGYIDYQDDGGWSPLVWACEHNHVDIVKLLLSEGADPQLPDVEGNVALHWAAFGGSIAIVELLLNFGGKLDSVNDQGDTPLHIASRHDNYNCVTIFVARGANFSIKNENDETCLDCAPEGSKSRQTLLVNSKLKGIIKKK